MASQTSPWLRAARIPMLVAMLPALLLIAALIYFTAWAGTYSFTNLELTGPNSIIWRWIGIDNYVRLFTRQGFLSSLWVSIVFTFFSAIVGQSLFGFVLASAMRGLRGGGRTADVVFFLFFWL